ncbi:MAG TPA: hypothetical protein VNG93_11565 [Candidatus Dormibacteraeota bacterium]|nr:hypothetical protein [Candidatus Dormibacteraeota bacterium]
MRLAPEETRPAFRLMLALGVVGLVILGVGLAQFITFEPPGQRTGEVARIVGIFDYDPRTQGATGANQDHFRTGQPFAAVVDWSSLPPLQEVGSAWFSGGFSVDAGGVGPAPAGALASRGVVPVNFGSQRFPAGRYELVVERFSKGRAVEVLARKTVVVLGG